MTATLDLSGIGNTPLVELHALPGVPAGTRVFAKLESTNPGGSLKDRPVARMLTQALAAGRFAGGRRLLDSSSGNAGIAYAALGARLGIGVTLVVPDNASGERLQRIRAHGAEILTTPASEGYDYAVLHARRLSEEQPERYWYCNQYDNPDNWRAHYEGTGAEILDQLQRLHGLQPDAFVGGVGTGGSFTGIGRRLREAHPGMHLVMLQPETFPGIEGLRPRQEGSFRPAVLDASLADERVTARSEDAYEFCHLLARQGLFVGPSSGANACAGARLAARGGYRVIVTLLCDTGERYVSTGMWST